MPLYVELHCHSGYSFGDGASLPEELAAQAERLGYSALALTDHNGVYGSMEFAHQAKGRGLHPITGAEVTLEDESRVVLLVESRAGYANLCRLLSTAHQTSERTRPRLSRRLLAAHAEGLILLSGGRSSDLGRAAERGERAAAERLARSYREWLGPGSFFVELQQNYVHGDTDRNRALVALARSLELPLVATNNVHYHRRERYRLHDALVAIRSRATLDGAHRQRRANHEFYLKSPEEMAWIFRHLPEARENTLRIAERCRGFDLTEDLGYVFPDFYRSGAGDETADEALERFCWEMFLQRYRGEPEAVRAEARVRLREEMGLVRHHRLCGFFLVYRDLLELGKEVAARCRRSGKGRALFDMPPGRGRGSSVSSIICYLIGLSPVDPVKAKLSLGRFLNRKLASVPDIDLDFPRDIREELIKAVHQRYGEEHVAMVCTFPTYRIRSAIRDLGLALGLPPADVDRLARLSEGGRADQVETEMRRLPEFAALLETPPWRHLVELSRELSGFPQHVSQHVGGIIISSRPLVEIVPVERTRMEGRLICQWDKDSCDSARFLKIDFLALGMLSAVEECLDLIVENGKPPVDLSRIPYDDAAVYERICEGDTVGVFQIESRAQIQMLPRTQPRNLEDLAVEVAIVRPGPIVGGSVNPYVRGREQQRRNPKSAGWYDHPLLIPVLRETLGCIIFQDQILEVCQAMAGFSVDRAEALRRAMSRKRSREAMEQFREEFVAGACAKGVPRRTAVRVFEKVVGFSEYGFPKGHAAAFAVLTYQSAWLCHYYPTEFVTGILNNLPMGFYPRDVLLKDAARHGVRFLRPDLNASEALCTVEGETVRLGLAFIAGIGGRAAEALVAERRRGGPFRSLPDFLRRVALPCAGIEALVHAGALDSFGLERRMLLWQLGLLARAQGWMHPDRAGSGGRAGRRQTSFFLSTEQDEVVLPGLTAWERMLADYRTLELSPDTHPLALLRPSLPKGMVASTQLRLIPDGKTVRTAGLVVTRQRPGTARGFMFLLVEDECGLINVVVSPKLYERRRAIIRGEPLIWLAGTVQNKGGSLNLIAAEIGSVPELLREQEDEPAGPARVLLQELCQAAPAAHQWR
ncbi:MAG: DNA polymerase III subunit alpha [Armatimonadota bacterium]